LLVFAAKNFELQQGFASFSCKLTRQQEAHVPRQVSHLLQSRFDLILHQWGFFGPPTINFGIL
jgi:hypothetical protein